MKKIAKMILNKFFCLFPIRNIIIFESNPDFSDNTYWIFKKLIENSTIRQKYRLVWFQGKYSTKSKEFLGVPITCVDYNGKNIIQIFRKFYYNATAKIIIDCNKYVYKLRERQYRVHLGHGMPIKLSLDYVESRGECDLIPILGDGFRDYYEKTYNGLPEVIKNVGYPRNEILTSGNGKDNIIIWMPTFRQHSSGIIGLKNNFPLGVPILKSETDLDILNNKLKECNYKLLIRMHPAQDPTIFKVKSLSNIVIADDEYVLKRAENLYALVSTAAALITDYSSIYYDFLLTGRNIGLTLEDADEYEKKWPLFIEDIKNNLPGEKLYSLSDLLQFVENVANDKDYSFEERESFRCNMGIERREASKIIVREILNFLNI